MPYVSEWNVRTGDTDFSGLVYTPVVIDQIVRSIQDLLGEVGYAPGTASERGLLYPAVHAEADYLDAIGIGDRVQIELTPNVGDTSLTINATGSLSEPVFEGSVTLVFVDADTSEPTPVPGELRDRLQAFS